MSIREALANKAERAIAERVFPGCVIGILEKGQVLIAPFGTYTYDPDSVRVTEESLYDCASITKSIPTATIALQLIAEKKLSLGDRVITFIPEYATPYRDEVSIWHLLTYTLGNALPLSQAGATPEEIFHTVCNEVTRKPGVVCNYSNTPAFLLGMCIERILGSFELAAIESVFRPRKMRTATFRPEGAVPTEREVFDEVHDPSARVFARHNTAVGHAGLFATASDLLAFISYTLSYPDERIYENALYHLGVSASLGWELDQQWMGRFRSPRTFGKTGYTGTSIVCDPDRQRALVILSNRTFPQAPGDRVAIDMFRESICDIVFS